MQEESEIPAEYELDKREQEILMQEELGIEMQEVQEILMQEEQEIPMQKKPKRTNVKIEICSICFGNLKKNIIWNLLQMLHKCT